MSKTVLSGLGVAVILALAAAPLLAAAR